MDYSMITIHDKIEKFFDSKIMQQSLRDIVFIKVKKSSDIVPDGDIEIQLERTNYPRMLIEACDFFIYKTADEFCKRLNGVHIIGTPDHFTFVKNGKALAIHVTTRDRNGPMWVLRDMRETTNHEVDHHYNYLDFITFLKSLEVDHKLIVKDKPKHDRLYDVNKLMFKLNSTLTREGNYCVDKASLKKQLIDIINEELDYDQ